MKKSLILILASFLFLTLAAQSSEPAGLIEVFGGKYRAILLNAPGIHSTGCTSMVTAQYGDVVYTLLGHEEGDEFQVMAARGSEILMRQCFYMNGEIAPDGSTFGNWFDDGTLKLKSFLKDIFSIDVSKRH